MQLLWLADVIRAGGMTVVEYTGWKTRGSEEYGNVFGIIVHHTASNPNSKPADEARIIAITGTERSDPPISELMLDREGVVWVLASGRATGVITGTAGPLKGYSDRNVLQIEACNSGSEGWTTKQYNAYVQLCAILVAHQATGYTVPVEKVVGHKEHQPGLKTDPSFDMDKFRTDIRNYSEGGITLYCKLGDNSEQVKEMQENVTDCGGHVGASNAPIDPANPYRYCDGSYGSNTAKGLASVIGGDGKTYQAAQRSALQRKLRSLTAGKPGPQGPMGPVGPAGKNGVDGKTPTTVTFGPTTATVTAAG